MLALICLQIPYALAADFNPAANANVSPAKATNFSNQEEYLLVTDAYKLHSEINGNGSKNLRLTWTIAPGYYLYQERFKFASANPYTHL
jgi:thiol:disulfide interchange protein DsbD